MKLTNQIESEVLGVIEGDIPFAKTVYQSILDEWLIDNITVQKVKEQLKTDYEDRGRFNYLYTYHVKPSDLVKMAKQRHNTHLLMIPSINLYLFPRKNTQKFQSLFKRTHQLFLVANLMSELKVNSEIIPVICKVFHEHELKVTIDVFPETGLKINIITR